jgi:phage tail sheath protein FI
VPGVYIEEIPSGIRLIEGVPTSITTFLGALHDEKPVHRRSKREPAQRAAPP